MTEAMITGVVAIIVCMINNAFQQYRTKAQHDETTTMISYKIDELTKRVDKHNSIIERTYALEKQMATMDEKVRVVNHRIADLEEKERV